jgi:Mor family transcriptional regulator
MDNLDEMKEALCEQLRQKTSFEDAELVSAVLFDVMCDLFAGEMLYIPKDTKRKGLRQALIKKFNGHNHRELAREFGYCVRNVYEILSNQKPQQLNL